MSEQSEGPTRQSLTRRDVFTIAGGIAIGTGLGRLKRGLDNQASHSKGHETRSSSQDEADLLKGMETPQKEIDALTDEINRHRRESGLNELETSRLLTKLADTICQSFAHIDPIANMASDDVAGENTRVVLARQIAQAYVDGRNRLESKAKQHLAAHTDESVTGSQADEINPLIVFGEGGYIEPGRTKPLIEDFGHYKRREIEDVLASPDIMHMGISSMRDQLGNRMSVLVAASLSK